MLSNQDKKEMLEMIASCVAGTNYAFQETPWTRKFLVLLRDTASSLPQDKPERKMPDGEYAECKDCADKPGSPTLCDVCLHNRALVGRLQEENRKLNNIVTKLSEPL